MWPNPHVPADLITFTEEILNGKLHFLCSVVRAWMMLWWIEIGLSFLNKSWNDDDLSQYVIFSAHSFKEFILLLRSLLWNIQTKGHYRNWDIINAFITVFLLFRHMCRAILANVLGFWLPFYRGCLHDLQNKISSPKLYLVVHSCCQMWRHGYRF